MSAAAAAIDRWLARLSTPRPAPLRLVTGFKAPAETRAPRTRISAPVARRTAAQRHSIKEHNGITMAEKSALLDAIADDLAAAIWADAYRANSVPLTKPVPVTTVAQRGRQDGRGLDLWAFRWQVWGDSDFSRQRREGRAWAQLRQNDDGRGGELVPGL